ncbi:MAG: CoA transferase [Chloroflexota bacterium]|nr:CoA transferase [Chloroflexota bacterium]MDE2960214.1 CoA transferase [Chloroflexota bacterium]
MTSLAAHANSEPALPLSGYRVLDLAGPMGVYCGKLLADMGADVIKVEPPGGDPMREIGPFIDGRPGPGRSLYWLHFNTNKRSVTLDTGTPAGVAALRKLALASDVVLETGPPGYMDTLGLGYDSLSAESLGLVYASITPFGQTGPYRDFKASDLVGFAMGGYMYVTGWPDTPPNKLWGSQAYHTASNRAYIAILLALYHRTMTGEGQYIDVSMQEAVAATTEHVNTTYNYTGESAVRCGFRHGGQFVATWRCQDGYASITTNTRKAWDDLRAWMDRDGMAGDLMDEQYNDHFVLRGEHSAHIEELIQAWAMLHTRQEITEFGQSNHHPWGPAATADEILDNEQLWGRGYLTRVDSADGRPPMVYSGDPYRLTEFTQPVRQTAPTPGEHNAEVLGGILGITPAELNAFTSEVGRDTG